MDSNLIILIITSVLAIGSMLAASLRQSWAKTTTIILNILVLWFGFQWQSWLGAIGGFASVLLLTFILSRTLLRNAVAKTNNWDDFSQSKK